MKFRIKVPEVEAMNFTPERIEHVKDFLEGIGYSLAFNTTFNEQRLLEIRIKNYYAFVPSGYWIVRELSDVIRVFSPEDFVKLYEPIDEAGLVQESYENS